MAPSALRNVSDPIFQTASANAPPPLVVARGLRLIPKFATRE
jgi:hypothetical protein